MFRRVIPSIRLQLHRVELNVINSILAIIFLFKYIIPLI